ncbi:MAG: M3 family oligoendopeptidase [Gemmatimonadaceae bacterium]
MALSELPTSPQALARATWEDISGHYESLATYPLTMANAAGWLSHWSRFEEIVGEAATLASIAYTCDTTDPAKEEAHLRFASEIAPRMEEQQTRLARRLLEVGYSRPELETMLLEFRTDAEIFREANVPLVAELEELDASYEKTLGAMTVEWDGERKTVQQLQPFLKSPDRSVRERAFHASAEPFLAQRDTLSELFDRMYTLRQCIARNAGFRNFQEFIFRAKHRFWYTPDDCASFHRAVEETVMPAIARLHEYRRERLGVSVLRPWDVTVELDRAVPLAPFETVPEFVERAQHIFDRVDPELGRDFRTMSKEQLLDLDNRQGKAPGGYCTTLQHRGRPFIFMNAVGVPDDVNTLIHEAGHCFHAFAASPQPLIWQRGTGMEAAELASMSMELLAAPYLARPDGYYSESDVRHAWLEHLEDILLTLAHVASVDAFQSWIYTSGQGDDGAARDRAWVEIRQRFERVVDWSGLEPERMARWYRQPHIFVSPFYYIEYGIAQLGALQIWRDSLADQPAAVARYRRALALGGTRSLPEIYATAGAKLVFDSETMGELVALVESRIDALRDDPGPAERAA